MLTKPILASDDKERETKEKNAIAQQTIVAYQTAVVAAFAGRV